jgi:hypothetical protein
MADIATAQAEVVLPKNSSLKQGTSIDKVTNLV